MLRRIRLEVDEDTLGRLSALAEADGRLWYREAELFLREAIAAEERRRARNASRRLARDPGAVSPSRREQAAR
jgi:hypothetical protein